MSDEKFNVEDSYKCVRKLGDLGTGRHGRSVLVGDSEDARTAHFSFATNIRHNWPSWNIVVFANGKILNIISQTVDGTPVHIFLWNELTGDLWLRQIEREKLLKWTATAVTAEPRNFVAMAELIVEQTESEYRVTHPAWCSLKFWCSFHLRRIEMEIRKLSLPALRKLNGLIDVRGSVNPVESAKPGGPAKAA